MLRSTLGALMLLMVAFPLVTMAQARSSAGKISPGLETLLAASTDPQDSISLVIAAADLQSFRNRHQNLMRVVHAYGPAQVVTVRVAVKHVSFLLNEPDVLFADRLRQPREEFTTGAYDLSANAINYAHRQFPLLKGDGTVVSVKELSFDTADIDIRGRSLQLGTADPLSSTHADIMATMIGGAGNSSPFALGAAPASLLGSSSYTTLLPDADSVYRKFNVSVQNHSYGVGIENYYGADAAAYDKSVHLNPTLLHVFSAGNIGGNTSTAGPYAGVAGMANLSGSFKMAKNILTVGAIDSFHKVMNASSRGPSYDGRIKPELVAFGEDGSSGAAALVSGAALLLQQAYKQLHNDSLPAASLVKALLINSARDVATPHPDYAGGYGSLDAQRAIESVLQSRYVQQTISQGQLQAFPLVVAPGTSELKLTLCWTDTAAQANALRSLVNDLDLVLVHPASGQSWEPWILNRKPNRDSLLSPAIRGRDTINNVEQVTVQMPPAGNYLVEVRGARVLTSPQHFSLAYQTDSLNSFVWTYPTATDPLEAGQHVLLRWRTNRVGNAVLAYESGGGWQTIASGIDLAQGYFAWNTPLINAATRLRLSPATGGSFLSDSFLLAPPLRMKVGYNCADSFLLYWNHNNSAAYRLYELGARYLQPSMMLNDTVVVLSKSQHPSQHYAVATVAGNLEGKRSYTIRYTTQGVNCYFSNFLVQLQGNLGLLSTQLGTLQGISQVQFLKWKGNGYVPIQVMTPQAALLQFTDSFLTRGVNTYRVMLVLQNGQMVLSDPASLYYFPDRQVIIYPNPAHQQQPVKIIVAEFDRFSIAVYDASGKLVYRKKITSQYEELAPLAKGIYLVRITDQQGVAFTEKLVVL